MTTRHVGGRTARVCGRSGIVFLVWILAAAGPAPKKTNVELTAGAGRSQTAGDYGISHTESQNRASIKGSHRWENGVAATATVGASGYSRDSDDQTVSTRDAHISPTVGWHGTYGGFEVGLVFATGRKYTRTWQVWLGHAYYHLFLSANDTTASVSTLENTSIGVGHKSDRVRVELASRLRLFAESDFGFKTEVRLLDHLWIGGALQIGSERHFAGTIGFDF